MSISYWQCRKFKENRVNEFINKFIIAITIDLSFLINYLCIFCKNWKILILNINMKSLNYIHPPLLLSPHQIIVIINSADLNYPNAIKILQIQD